MAEAKDDISSARVACTEDEFAEAFTINFGNDASQMSLQDAFSRFLSVKKKSVPKGKKRKKKRSLKRMAELRDMFLTQALKYRGIPYAKRYFTPEDPEYESPFFLDCCGLIRRVMRDLKKEFGFCIGPWNQCYMYDTLWKTVKMKDMKPGDLVFVRGTYYCPKKRQQKHNITHVEIWMGDGEKSLGARWQRGCVQIFDSYKFDSKSYHIEEFIFKSIDPWLSGHCRSHCDLHKWKIRKVKPKNKYSIFADGQQVNSQSSFTSSSTSTDRTKPDSVVTLEDDLEDVNASDPDSDSDLHPSSDF